MLFQKGQKTKIQDLGLNQVFTMDCNISADFTIDITCFGVDANNKLSDDRYMVFYNQKSSPAGEVKLLQDAPAGRFEINLNALPSQIAKLVFTAAIDGAQTMASLKKLQLCMAEHRFELTGSDFSQEKAIIIAELYKKDGVWRFGAVGQGFNGGLHALLTYFGGQAASEPAPVAAPVARSPATSSTVPVNTKKKVFLEKRVNLEKNLQAQAPGILSLAKKAAVSLEKRGLGEHRAKVALCLDISASMSKTYASGLMQRFAERILALACRMDDDGSIDVFLFGEDGYEAGALSFKDFAGYVARMNKRYPLEGDTKYAKAIELVRKHYTDYRYERSEPLKMELPVYVMFVTDGKPSDKTACTKALKNASYEPIFWQFMGLSEKSIWGEPDFSYLEKLDDLEGRFLDNADFFKVENLASMSDEELYEKLTNEYPKWVQNARMRAMIED